MIDVEAHVANCRMAKIIIIITIAKSLQYRKSEVKLDAGYIVPDIIWEICQVF